MKTPSNDMLCSSCVLEGKTWWNGMNLDNKHLAHAVHLSGGPNFCDQIGLRLDDCRASIH